MERDGQIMRNRRKGAILVASKLDLVRGTRAGHPDGFGFLVPDDGGATCSCARGRCRRCCTATASMARPGVDRRGRREGEIVEVLERANGGSSGGCWREHGVCSSCPETSASATTC